MNKQKKILITGASGQLGQEFVSYLKQTTFQLKALTREKADISHSLGLADLKDEILLFKPDFLINCAAYTSVDMAEEKGAMAESVNSDALAVIAVMAQELDFKILHFSTDYVFDGSGDEPWSEEDEPFPINIYGLTKREGEVVLLESGLALVLRVSWLYSEFGSNFPKTINRLLGEKDELNIVDDQFSSPTWAKPLVEFAVTKLLCNADLFNGSLYHYSEDGECSWYDVAAVINEKYNKRLNAVSSKEFLQVAKRPAYSKLDNTLAKEKLGLEPNTWQENLKEFLKIIQ
jgi:dTDP-4-dehydrorhamnose reductase